MIEDLINKSKHISLDYEMIREEVKENIGNNCLLKRKNKSLIFHLKLALYTIIICLISVLITIDIKDRKYQKTPESPPEEQTPIGPAGGIDPGILSKSFLIENFDTFVAFGSHSNVLFTDQMILNSNLITEDAKGKMIEYINMQGDAYQKYYNIHIGVKDGKDIIYITHLSTPYTAFTFESNLDYDLLSIIIEFENMCNIQLSQDFLMSRNWDDELKINKSGIHLNFKEVEGVYVPYYVLMINGNVYILDK